MLIRIDHHNVLFLMNTITTEKKIGVIILDTLDRDVDSYNYSNNDAEHLVESSPKDDNVSLKGIGSSSALPNCNILLESPNVEVCAADSTIFS